MVLGDAVWSRLGKHRAKLLLSTLGSKDERVAEMGTRLAMWEEGRMEELARRVAQQSLDDREGRPDRGQETTKDRKTRLGQNV
eukprot:4904445-Lingulodinium_polyedra.AAC.1